jgi:hypothetical protein
MKLVLNMALKQAGYVARTFNFELNSLVIEKVRIAYPTWLKREFMGLERFVC